MGERGQNRANVEHMASELKKHQDRAGRPISSGEAKRQIVEMARNTDAKKEAGALRNKRKRGPKEVAPPERRTGRITVDLGRKKG